MIPTFSLIPNESIISHCNTSLASTVSYTDFQVPTLHTQCDNLMFSFDLSPHLNPGRTLKNGLKSGLDCQKVQSNTLPRSSSVLRVDII